MPAPRQFATREGDWSRGRSGEDLLILGVILGLAQLGGHDHQLVVHLALGEGLTELGDILAGPGSKRGNALVRRAGSVSDGEVQPSLTLPARLTNEPEASATGKSTRRG